MWAINRLARNLAPLGYIGTALFVRWHFWLHCKKLKGLAKPLRKNKVMVNFRD